MKLNFQDSNLLNRRMASVSPQNGSGDNQGASSLEVKGNFVCFLSNVHKI